MARHPDAPGCTWCGHPDHAAGDCQRIVNVRRYTRGAPPEETSASCPCRKDLS